MLENEWNYEKNNESGISFDYASKHPGQKYWWKCEKGHEWNQSFCDRQRGRGCPYCSNRIVLKGYNDLASQYPQLLLEWDYEKNALENIYPDNVICGSSQYAWWHCQQNHSYRTKIYNRTQGRKCPFCTKHKLLVGFNDFATEHPDLLGEWNYEKNAINPTEIMSGARTKLKIWWKCNEGHEWESTIANRIKGRGCPICAVDSRTINRKKAILITRGSLAEVKPEILKEWDYSKNETLGINPYEVTIGSSIKVWWKCSVCNHEWNAPISSRCKIHGTGCPVCGIELATQNHYEAVLSNNGSFASNYPNLLPIWNYRKNEELGLKPDQLTAFSKQIVWWVCEKGHEYKQRIYNKTAGIGCPICSKERRTSFPEQAIFYYVKKLYPDAINGEREILSPFELDIYIPSINTGIEYDGQAWHKDTQKDVKKNKMCEKNGIRLFRIREKECADLSDSYSINIVYDNDEVHLNSVIHQLFDLLNKDYSHIIIDTNIDRSKIYEQYILSEKENSIAVRAPQLLCEWDYEKNGYIKPEFVNYGTQKKFWWKCENNHEWKGSVANRVRSKTCPICSKHVIVEGINDFASQHHELLKEWDYEKNNNQKLFPNKIAPQSQKKAWWICSNGHSWETIVGLRVKGTGCPYCVGNRTLTGLNDFASQHPELLKEWDYEKNDINPNMISQTSKEKVWWICKYGHKYMQNIVDKVKGCGCTICSGKTVLPGFNDLQHLYPQIAAEWSFDDNILHPTDVTSKSNKKVWWKCEKGHKWEAAISDRVGSDNRTGTNCPVCANRIVLQGYNDLKTTHPKLLEEWNYEKNIGISPDEVYFGARTKVWWKCNQCDYEWNTSIRQRCLIGRGCPQCAHKKINESRKKRVGQYSVDGDLLSEYSSITEAKEKTGILHITSVCNGSRKSAGGFVWKYID